MEDILPCAVSDAIIDISASMAPSTSHFDQDPILALLRPEILSCKDHISFAILPFPSLLQVGDVQHMIFQPSDNGPAWMNPQQREINKNDIILNTTTTTPIK